MNFSQSEPFKRLYSYLLKRKVFFLKPTVDKFLAIYLDIKEPSIKLRSKFGSDTYLTYDLLLNLCSSDTKLNSIVFPLGPI